MSNQLKRGEYSNPKKFFFNKKMKEKILFPARAF